MDGNPNALVKVDVGDGRVVVVEAHNVNPERPVGIGNVLSFAAVTTLKVTLEWQRTRHAAGG